MLAKLILYSFSLLTQFYLRPQEKPNPDHFDKKTTSDMEPSSEQNELSMHKESIDAYQFQVSRHQQSMNYFALFNGALLVAYCTLLTSTTSVKHPSQDVYCLSNNYDPLVVAIAILGLIASITWLLSIKGNIFWMNNWMKCIELRKTHNPYRLVFSKDVKNNNDILPANTSFSGCFSTQKLSLVFVFFVIVAWSFALLFICCGMASEVTKTDECCCNCFTTFNAPNHPLLSVSCIFISFICLIVLCSLICICAPKALKNILKSDLSGKIGMKIK